MCWSSESLDPKIVRSRICYEYYFDYVDSFETNGVVFDKNGCKIYVDNDSLNFLKGSLVDYQKEGLNQGIKFINPNAKAVCGCGESFTI